MIDSLLSMDPVAVVFLGIVASIVVQVFKGLLPVSAKKFIPLGVILAMILIGVGLAVYSERDLVAGVAEGLLAGAASVGLYEGSNAIPGLDKVANSAGWIKRRPAGD